MSSYRMVPIALAFVAGLSGCTNRPAAFSETDRAAIRSTVEQFTTAMRTGDFATAASLYSEDGVFMPPNGPHAEGRAAIEKSLGGMGGFQAFSQSVVEVDGEGDLAYGRATYDVTFTPPNAKAPVNDRGKVLFVLQKQPDGSWRTIRGMFNSDLPAPR
ncbi:MAG: SgcJ/EcaC family oxidoreductase [Gemmatimonadaceae bacterium]